MKTLRLLLTALTIACVSTAVAEAQTLSVADRTSSRTYTRAELLALSATRDVSVADDPVFKRAMTYRAVPMAALLKDLSIAADDYVQVRATDNFSVAVPGLLLKQAAPREVEAFLAIEDPAKPWPRLTKGTAKVGAGPFYLVWRAPKTAGVSSEYWAYQLAAFTVTDSPVKRWPGLGVAADVPAADPIRRGLDRFVAVCMACHRFNGEGEGAQGPDLGRPMNAVAYFQPTALKKLLRDPESVRTWPERKMPAFATASLSDADIDAVVAWLTYKTQQPR
jgi:mono/diheme cytochrome c family protein